ncbi:calcium-binding protein [Mesorhizobium sp. CN2-181]|uniref:calcium-binding protein n=1 Tax=Mesorhizobium yinganensis TaxID=3157707 RepID=UPI0032B85F93
MTEFVGTDAGEIADATDGTLFGFTGGTVADLTDADGDIFRALDGGDVIESGAGDDTLDGGAGDDFLNGGAGSDQLIGGLGDDSYEVDSLGDTVVEEAGEGTDSIETSLLNYSLASLPAVENLTIVSLSEIDGLVATATGNDLDNVLSENFLRPGQVTLIGGAGNDTFLGGTVEDLCYGGVGDDTYVFREGKGAGHAITVFENENEGIDTQLYQSLTETRTVSLYDNVENLIIKDHNNLGNYSGNSIDNYIEVEIRDNYNTSDPQKFNVIHGLDGNDTIVGSQFVDDISGDAGNDILDGGGGDDSLTGGSGDDVYYVVGVGDTVTELAGGGGDRVAARGDYALGAGQEIELLTTTNYGAVRNIDLKGNELAQAIVGNDGNNWLHDGGFGAADTLRGRGGNDFYTVYNSSAVVIEAKGQGDFDRLAAGVDYVLAQGVEIESLRTTGQHATYGINLTGNEFSQQIIGNDGDNRIDGKGGSDTIQTGLGSDTVVFSTALGGSVDKIVDFDTAEDQIALDHAIFTALGLGALDASAFKDNILATRDADDRIIYNSNTGSLFYDADGLGGAAAVKFASVAVGLSLTAADFQII